MTPKTKAQIDHIDKMLDEMLALDEWNDDIVNNFSQLTLSKAQLVTALAEQWRLEYDGV